MRFAVPTETRETALLRYGAALLGVAVAIFVRWLLDPILGDNVAFLTLYGAVAFACWLGGWRPAVVAAITGFLAADLLFLPPRLSPVIHTYVAIAILCGYTFSTGFIIYLGNAMRRGSARIESYAAMLDSGFDAIFVLDEQH